MQPGVGQQARPRQHREPDQHGGLQGVVSQFEKNGLGSTVKSWVGTGPNQPISADEVQRTLGPDLLQQLSAKSGG